ncbi:MAG TPA: VCBS repeat-containing protein [Miltoncostaeaceae bacterium]|nr:VCBS repeat-containing protein [Miltoncostaeaceae bacterium]
MRGRLIGIAVATALALGSSAAAAMGAISLNPLPTRPTAGLDAVRTADLNRDGRPDIVGSGFGAWVYLNLPGGLSPGDGFGGGGGGSRPAIADLNGDGLMDVALAGQDGASLLLGDGAGHLRPDPLVQLPPASAVAAGGMNGDGRTDLVLADGRGVDVFLGNAAGGLDPAPGGGATIPGGARQVELADLNLDGRLDVVLIRPDGAGSSQAEARLGDGTGGFSAPHGIPTGPGPVDVAIGDMNGDGIPDVVSANGFEPVVATVALGDGHGDFASRPPVAIPGPHGGAGTVAVGDIDRDGRLDVAYALRNAGNGDLAVLRNDGAGGLSPAGFCAIRDGSPGRIATADLDGDGRADIVLPVGPLGSVLEVLRSSPVPPEQGFDLCGSPLQPPFATPFAAAAAAAPKPARISVARVVHARRGRRVALRVTANRTLALRGVLWRGRTAITTVRATIRRGPNRLVVKQALRHGTYRLVLTARAPDGVTAPANAVSLVVR